MAQASVKERIRYQLPDPALQHLCRNESKQRNDVSLHLRSKRMHSNLHEENRGTGDDQAFYPPGEGWKTKRECTSGRHASSVGRGQRIISLKFNRGRRELRLCPLDSATQPSYQFQTYRSGSGTVGKLRCPALSTARTAKITLSFDSGSVQLVLSPHDWTCSQ